MVRAQAGVNATLAPVGRARVQFRRTELLREKASQRSLGSKMRHEILAAAAVAIFWLHVGVMAFNVFGLIAIPLGAWRGLAFVRVFWWRALHLGALGIVALQAVLGRACFLTLWESDLLAQAGRAASRAPLIETWITRIVFWPFPLWVFAVLYVGVGVYALLLWWLVPPKFARHPRGSGP